MCGIAGLIRYPKGKLNPDMIRLMTNSIKHRGPDDEGFLLFSRELNTAIPFGGNDTPPDVYQSGLSYAPAAAHENLVQKFSSHQISVLLGHRRLSIIDLSPSGHQPMQLQKQAVWITYNGEIFNFIEIRRELEAAGYSFHSESDTEVILTAYQHWGSACLHKFNGMFAFIIIDLNRNQLFAARDRFGVKPLYFWESPEGFLAFASEIKQFTFLPGWHSKAHISGAFNYLSAGITDSSTTTMFDGVFQLRGGEYIECGLDLSKMPTPKAWYQLKKTPSVISFKEATEQFQALFKDAIRLRMRADVDIGSCLSGGLDSSAIVCMANLLLNGTGNINRQKTFSACSHIARFDERHYMDEVIKHTGVFGHFVIPSVDVLLDMTKKIVWHQDQPFGSTSIFAQYLVFDMAKKANVKVMLDGQGSDENLAGYTPFWAAHLAQLFKELRWWSLIKETYLLNTISPSMALFPKSIVKHFIPKRIKNYIQTNPLTSSDRWINFHQFPNDKPSSFLMTQHSEIGHLVDQLSYDQITRTSLPALLRYEDRNSMANSIEARTPFLDYRLVEFIFNLPAHYKISKGYTKRVMREALKGILPENVRTRTDKLGFATAEEVWMCEEKPEIFKKAVAEAVEKSQGLINDHALTIAEKMLSQQIPFNWILWRIINFGHWIETFNVTIK